MSVAERTDAARPAASALPHRRRTLARVLRSIAIAVVLAALLLPLGAAALGVRLLVVDGGSMAPTYGVGDVLIVGAPTGDDLVTGEPIVIGDDASRYVHRVIEVDGDRARLRGDANAAADPGWITQSDVTAVVQAHLAQPGAALFLAATSTEGRIALALVLVFLLLVPFFPSPRMVRFSGVSAPASPSEGSTAPESGTTPENRTRAGGDGSARARPRTARTTYVPTDPGGRP